MRACTRTHTQKDVYARRWVQARWKVLWMCTSLFPRKTSPVCSVGKVAKRWEYCFQWPCHICILLCAQGVLDHKFDSLCTTGCSIVELLQGMCKAANGKPIVLINPTRLGGHFHAPPRCGEMRFVCVFCSIPLRFAVFVYVLLSCVCLHVVDMYM